MLALRPPPPPRALGRSSDEPPTLVARLTYSVPVRGCGGWAAPGGRADGRTEPGGGEAVIIELAASTLAAMRPSRSRAVSAGRSSRQLRSEGEEGKS